MKRDITKAPTTVILAIVGVILILGAFFIGRATAPEKLPWHSDGVVYYKNSSSILGVYPAFVVIYNDTLYIPAQEIIGKKAKARLVKIAVADTEKYEVRTIPARSDTTTIFNLKVRISIPRLYAIQRKGKWIIYVREGEQIPTASSISFVELFFFPESHYQLVK